MAKAYGTNGAVNPAVATVTGDIVHGRFLYSADSAIVKGVVAVRTRGIDHTITERNGSVGSVWGVGVKRDGGRENALLVLAIEDIRDVGSAPASSCKVIMLPLH